MKCFRLPASTAHTPGYTELRRHIVVGAPALIAACLASPNKLLAAVDQSESDDQLDRFIVATNERVAALKADASASGQNKYVRYLAESVVKVEHVSAATISART